MTDTDPGRLRALAFGDLDGTRWGALLSAGATALVIGDDRGAAFCPGPVSVQPDPDGRAWRISAEGVSLNVLPAGNEPIPADARPAAGEVTGVQEICRVEGSLAGVGSADLRAVGTRCELDGLDLASLHSARAVGGWFGTDDAFIVVALRPARAFGQERDLVAATLFEPDGWVEVDDPRLSTTYDDRGVPLRAGLELWISEGEQEFPRRAAGEALGTGAVAEADGLRLRAVPLRCHGREREGRGVYLLADL